MINHTTIKKKKKSLPLHYKIRMALHTQNGWYLGRLIPHYYVLKYCSNLVLHP